MLRRILSFMLIFSVLAVSTLGAAHAAENLQEKETGIHFHIGIDDHHHDHHEHDHDLNGDHAFNHDHDHEEGGHIHLFFQITAPSSLHIDQFQQDQAGTRQSIYPSRKLAPPVPPPNA